MFSKPPNIFWNNTVNLISSLKKLQKQFGDLVKETIKFKFKYCL